MKKLVKLLIGVVISGGLMLGFFALLGWVVEIIATNIHPLVLTIIFLVIIVYALLVNIPEEE